jgi:GT2 family glycosyltransferase
VVQSNREGGVAVTAIVPSWNRRDHLLACVRSLLRSDHSPLEVIVVDNASSDGSADAVRTAHPTVRVIEHEENRGFTGAVNRGLEEARRAGSRYAFLLNDDATVARDCVRLLVAAAESGAAHVVGPSIYFAARPDVLWSAGGAAAPRRGQAWMLGCGERDQGQFGTRARDVGFVAGCALLARLDVVAEVGFFDDRFFAYCEDIEWGARVRRAGHRILHHPQARVWHDIDLERQAASPPYLYYMRRNRLLWMRLDGAPWWARLRVVLGEDLRTVVSWSIFPRWRRQRPLRRVVLRALLDYYRGRFGASPL